MVPARVHLSFQIWGSFLVHTMGFGGSIGTGARSAWWGDGSAIGKNWKPCSVICQILNKFISSLQGVSSLSHVKKKQEYSWKSKINLKKGL